MKILRGDVVFVNFGNNLGSEQGNFRPAVILQNDISNKYSPTTIIAPLTSTIYDKDYPTNVFVSAIKSNLKKDSTILLNQIKTIDKSRILKKLTSLDRSLFEEINLAIAYSLGLE
jgi:mRNA interferase MazF